MKNVGTTATNLMFCVQHTILCMPVAAREIVSVYGRCLSHSKFFDLPKSIHSRIDVIQWHEKDMNQISHIRYNMTRIQDKRCSKFH